MSASTKRQPWVTVAVFEDSSTGKSLETFLRGNGIEARTYNDRLLQLFLFLCPPQVTFRVQVRENFLKKTIDLLDMETPAVLQKAIHCPACGSLRVNYPQMTRKFFLPTLLLHLGIIFRIIEHECYCENCHNIWNLSDGKSAVSKIHPSKTFPFDKAR